MSSFNEEDPTLPLDFDGSANTDQLTEVTFGLGGHLEYPDGSIPMVAKTSSGRMSPVRARTMKEYDQQMAELKKENFSLKLRIYFLEERMQQKFDGNGEDLFKTNIELKVEVESLKKELLDKQDLLKKASNALESISAQHQVELQQARDAQHAATTNTEDTEQELQQFQKQMQQQSEVNQTLQSQLQEAQQKLQELISVNRELDNANRQLQVANQKLEDQVDGGDHSMGARERNSLPETLAEKERIIEQLKSVVKTKELIIEQQEEERKDAVKDIQAEVDKKDKQIQTLMSQMSAMEESLNQNAQQKQSDLQKQLNESQIQLKQHEQDTQNKQHMIGKLEDLIRERDKSNKDLQDKVMQLEKDNKLHEEHALKRDKAIQGLAMSLQQKTNELEDLNSLLEEKDSIVNKAKDQIHKAHMEKYEGIQKQQTESADKDNRIGELEALVREKQLENERIQKALGRREAELHRTTSELEKADEVLRQREDSMQNLRDQLQDEKQRATERLEALGNHFQAMLDDAQRQIQNQEKMLQRLTRSLQDKDRQLQDYVNMVKEQEPLHESKDSIISNLRDRLKEKETTVEEAMDDKFKSLEEKDTEIRQLKMALRERDRDIERANQMLLTTEETIDTLENEAKEKDQAMKQLANALKAQQRAMEDTADSHARAIDQKEALITKLRNSLAVKDRSLEEEIRQSPSATDAIIQQLQQRVQEKENLLQEVMVERGRAADSNDQATKELLNKLRAKDNEIKEIQEWGNREITELNRKLQNVQTELNKKDYELQTIENRATWTEEQQQEMLDKMRAALNEKDKTIEALVESAREKDKLFRKMKESGVVQDPLYADKLAELQQTKDELARLQNDLQNQQDLIERLRFAAERRSPRPDTVSRSQLQDAEYELGKRTEALTRSLRAEKLAKQELKELKQQLREQMYASPEEVNKLKQQISELKEQLDRPGTPQRSQTTVGGESDAQMQRVMQDQMEELRNLNEALRAERELYMNRNNTSPDKNRSGEAFEIELAAVQALRKQLEEGVARNNRMRGLLEKQIAEEKAHREKGRGDNPQTIAELQEQIHTLRNQLEESGRWNTSLQARLNQQPSQQRGGGVGGATEDKELQTSLSQERRDHTHLNDTASSNDTTRYQSYLPSFCKLPDMLDESSLSQMSPDDLQETVKALKEQLVQAHARNEELQQQLRSLEGMRDIPGQNDQDVNNTTNPSTAVELQKQVEQLQLIVTETRKQKIVTEKQLESILSAPVSDREAKVVNILKEQLSQTREKLRQSQIARQASGDGKPGETDLTGRPSNIDLQNKVKRLRSQLRHSENVNNLLKRQIELNTKCESVPAGFNPELIVQMAKEIERLKDELENNRRQSQEMEVKKLAKPPSGSGKGYTSQLPEADGQGGTISMPVEAQRALQRQMEGMRSELNDAKVQNKLLQGKLASTEATVRSQTDKMKYYRGMLEDTGLLPRSPVRSHSESNISTLSASPAGSRQRPVSVSTENLSARGRDASPARALSPSLSLKGLNLAQFKDYGASSDVGELKDQVGELKTQLGRYHRIIRTLQNKLRHASSERLSQRDFSPEDYTKGKLGEEVEMLRRQLRQAEDSNASLQRHLVARPGVDQSALVKSLQSENLRLKKLLSNSQDLCESLQTRLQQLTEFLNELLHQDENGEVDVIDITPERVTSLKETLNQTRSMLGQLAVSLSLDGSDDDHQEADDVDLDTQREKAALEAQLQEATSQIHQMKQQLDQATQGSKDGDTQKEVDALRDQNSQLLQDNNALLHQSEEQRELLADLEQVNEQLKQVVVALEEENAQLKGGAVDIQTALHGVQQESEKLRQDVEEKEQANRRLKEVLQQSQVSADKLRAELARLSEELQKKDNTIDKLHRKLKHAQQKLGSNIDSTGQNLLSADRSKEDLDTDSVKSNESLESIERGRHQSTTQGSYRPVEVSVECMSENSTTSSHPKSHGKKKQRILSGPNGITEDGDVEGTQTSVDFNKYITQTSPTRHDFSESDYSDIPTNRQAWLRAQAPYDQYESEEDPTGQGPQLAGQQQVSSQESTEPDLLGVQKTGLGISGDSLFPSSSVSESINQISKSRDSLPMDQGDAAKMELERLQEQLKVAHDWNETLQDELSLYEKLNISVGIQSSPTMGTHSSQTAPDPETILQQHLDEIRALRKKLEESIHNNDQLRMKLEQQLAQTRQGVTNVYMRERPAGQTAPDASQVDQLNRELEEMRQQTREKAAEVQEQHRKEIDALLREKREQVQKIQLQYAESEQALAQVCRELKSLKGEANRLKEQLVESQDLNTTLKLELQVYQQMHKKYDKSGSKGVESHGKRGIDLNVLLEEIQHLRVQLERSIQANNALRQQLEQQIEKGKGESHINIHHLPPQQTTTQMPTGDALKDPLAGILGETYIDRMEKYTTEPGASTKPFMRRTQGSPGGQDGHYPYTNGVMEESIVPQNAGVSGDRGSTRYTQYLDTLTTGGDRDLRRSPVGTRNQQTTYRDGIASPPTRLISRTGDDSIDHGGKDHMDQLNRLQETSPNNTFQVHDLSGEERSPVRRALFGGPSRYQPTGGQDSMLSTHSAPAAILRDSDLDLGSGWGRTRPSDSGMRYSIHDPLRPPSQPDPSTQDDAFPTQDILPPHSETGSSPKRVGSDLRTLYAIGELDDYELLKKQIAESLVILCGMEARVRERLKAFRQQSQTQSLEYSTLKDIAGAIDNIKVYLKEEHRLVALFWMSQLPEKNELGHFVDTKTQSENHSLQQELASLRSKYEIATDHLRTAQLKLAANNKKKEIMEEAIYKQLSKTHNVLKHARGNLEAQYRQAGVEPSS